MPHAIGSNRCAMTPEKKAALKTFIMKQKQKKKEEEEQDEALRNERQRLAEKKLRDQHTLEEVNTQIVQLEKKLAEYKQEKHDLFSQLKKVLHQEDEQRKRIQQIQQQHAKDASEVLAKVGPAPPPMPLLSSGASPIDDAVSLVQQAMQQQQTQFQQLTPPTPISAGASPNTMGGGGGAGGLSTISSMTSLKRQRSPSPVTPTAIKEQGGYPAYFSSPKRLSISYQRSPYQSVGFGQEIHSPPGAGVSMTQQRIQQPPSTGPTLGGQSPLLSPGLGLTNSGQFHFQGYLPSGVQGSASLAQASMGGQGGQGLMQQVGGRAPFRSPHDMRSGGQMGSMGQTTTGTHMNLNTTQRPPAHVAHVGPPGGGIPIVPPQKRMGSITSGYPVHKPPHATPPTFQQQRPFFNPRGNPFPHPGHRFM